MAAIPRSKGRGVFASGGPKVSGEKFSARFGLSCFWVASLPVTTPETGKDHPKTWNQIGSVAGAVKSEAW